MVQIIPAAQRRETFGGRIGRDIGEGIKSGMHSARLARLEKEKDERKAAQEEKMINLRAEKEFEKVKALQELKHSHEMESLEKRYKEQYAAKYGEMKNMMKELGLDDLLGGEGSPEGKLPSEPSGMGTEPNEKPSGKKEYPPLIPQSKIAKMAIVNPNLANQYQKYNEQITKQKQHDEKMQQQSPQAHFETEEAKLEAKRQSDYANEIVKDYKSVESTKNDLKQMVALAKTGKLSTPGMVKALNTFGIPVGVLNNPLTEAYQKLENNFVKGVSNFFPGQVRVYEAQTYMKTIPSLLNTDEGKQIVAKNLQLENEAKEIRYNAYKDILKENKGKKPRNLDIEIAERTNDKLNKLGDEYQKNIEKAISKYGPKVTMYSADGSKRYEVPMDKIEDALKQGAIFK